MWVAEKMLFHLARCLYRTEVALSSDMKNALQHVDTYDAYRADQIGRILGAAERYCVQIADRTVLDFGCNDGAISAEYLRRGASRVVGVDIDERAIQRARELHSDERLAFAQNKANKIALEDRSVDTAISYDVFEHVSEPAAALEELRRVLTPGGKALIGTWSWWHPFAPHLWAAMPVPWAHVVCSERTVLRACRRVYHSPWYVPNMHDYGKDGKRLADRYTHEAISTDYLNKYLIRDFERAFRASGFACETHALPFGSRYARWTGVFLRTPWLRELVSGYVWCVLTKPADQEADDDTEEAGASAGRCEGAGRRPRRAYKACA